MQPRAQQRKPSQASGTPLGSQGSALTPATRGLGWFSRRNARTPVPPPTASPPTSKAQAVVKEKTTAAVQPAPNPDPETQNAQLVAAQLASSMLPSFDPWALLSSTTSFANQLLTHFTGALSQQRAEQLLQEASNREREHQQQTLPPYVWHYLAPVPASELRYYRKLSSLTALTYKLHLVTPRNMRRMHNLELITTSWACDIRPYEHSKTAEEVGEDGDGMAVSFGQAREVYRSLRSDEDRANIVSLPKDVSRHVSLVQQQEQQQQQQPTQVPSWRSSTDALAARLAEAAASASLPFTSAAGSLYAGLTSLPLPLGAGGRPAAPGSTSLPLAGSNGSDSPNTPGVQTHVSAATIAAVAVAELSQHRQQAQQEATPQQPLSAASVRGVAVAGQGMGSVLAPVTQSYSCPSQWYVVDDVPAETRIFVIQGSDTVDHWKLNLTFDPVVFEDPALGIKVHRGVYEAAIVLYERFLPLVYEHLETSPFAKVSFVGHSIGGSMATLLMLMYRLRGVLPPHSIAPVYTYGAPAVFCQTSQCGPECGSTAAATGADRSTAACNLPEAAAAMTTTPMAVASGTDSHSNGSSSSKASPSQANGTPSLSSSRTPSSPSATPHSPPTPATPPTASAPNPVSIVAPAVAAATLAASASDGGCGCGNGEELLARLGLPEECIRNLTMARDVVPRAFTCDYSPVADILKGWGPSFREHCCLNRDGRKHLYYFLGRMVVLQPDAWHSFVAGDKYHPMLPPGPEIYDIVDMSSQEDAQRHYHYDASSNGYSHHHHNGSSSTDGHNTSGSTSGVSSSSSFNSGGSTAHGLVAADGSDGSSHSSRVMANNRSANGNVNGNMALGREKTAGMSAPVAVVSYEDEEGVVTATAALTATQRAREREALLRREPLTKLGPPARSVVEALQALADTPHPLETLADPGAYLSQGIISRYHNPEHYSKALGRLYHLKKQQQQQLQGNALQQDQPAAATVASAAATAAATARLN